MNEYETELENNSWIPAQLLGPMQKLLLNYFDKGNEKAYPGLDGWLFFRPAVDYLIMPGFLNPSRLNERRKDSNEYTKPPQPDPLPAIISFHQQLKERGIELILVPAPVKLSLHPEYFSKRFDMDHPPLQNESYQEFIQALQHASIRVLDPLPILQGAFQFSGNPQFLKTDTHWTPGAMEIVASRLSKYIEQEISLSTPKHSYVRIPMSLNNQGDIINLLKLPTTQQLYKKQTVSIRQVKDQRTNSMWHTTPSAEILVLGDSYTNIYSLPILGWGQAAGLAEQLSFFLQRPIATIIQNQNGAYATRLELQQEIAHGNDRLANVKVVIWEFAARELVLGDWKMIELFKPIDQSGVPS